MEKTDMDNFETDYLIEEISKCEDVEQLKKEILPKLKSQQEQWRQKIGLILNESGTTKTDFAEKCGVSRQMVDKWCKGSIPRKRETFLRIGMVAGYGIEKMNQLLQRYGHYPALYSKSLEDCVCIYVIQKDYGAETIFRFDYILKRIKESVIGEGFEETEEVSTATFDEKLSEVKDVEELEQFIAENSSVFAGAYQKFFAFVTMNLTQNLDEGFAENIYDMAQGQGWSSSLRQTVSGIRQGKRYPTRNKIISLGLHLGMDHEQIDEMLSYMRMEPLCGKNIFESVIIFILEDASLNNLLDSGSQDYDPDALCRYAREVLSHFEDPEIDSFLSELSEINDD